MDDSPGPSEVTLHTQEISADRVAALVEDINRTGYGVIPGFIEAGDLDRMQAFVAEAVKLSNGEYTGFIGPNSVRGSGLDELAKSRPFRAMIEQIYQRGTGQKPPKQDFYLLLRCLTGRGARQHSYLFHYDSYIITMLIPVVVPTTGQTGDFLMLPNTRAIRKRYLFNAVDKVILDNPVTQWALRTLTKMGAISPTRIKLTPGSAYFFWGYRSVHTNEPCDPDQVRATALFHYANPHAGAALV
jgi:hypothetical protein